MRPRKCSYASVVIQPEPVPVLGQSGDSMPTSSTPACSRATFTKPPMYDRGSQASSASPLAGEPSWDEVVERGVVGQERHRLMDEVQNGNADQKSLRRRSNGHILS